MNRIRTNILTKHAAALDKWDALDPHAVRDSAPESERRLRRSSVILIASGSVGRRAVLSLARLPLRTLCVLPLREQDAALADAARRVPGLLADQLHAFPAPFSDTSFGAAAAGYHFIAVATDRPRPELYERLNGICLRVARSWTRVHVWGAEVTLGPTVMPGVTACYGCYMRRRRSNERRQNVWAAQDQFLRNDPDFTFEGSLELIERLAVAYLTAEVTRFLTGSPPPLALGREVLFDTLLQTQQISQVVPVEGCPECRPPLRGTRAAGGGELGAMVGRLTSRLGGHADVD